MILTLQNTGLGAHFLDNAAMLELAPMSVLRDVRLASVLRAEQDRFVRQIDWLIARGYTSFRKAKGASYHYPRAYLVLILCYLSSNLGDGDCFYRCQFSLPPFTRALKLTLTV